LLIAERYRDRRVFMAGDAVHLVIPTGGLGMNTGVGDAFDLSWKLAGVIKGWGGPGLLDGYEQERRPIGARNVAAAGWAAAGVPIWRGLVTPAASDDTPEARQSAGNSPRPLRSTIAGCMAWWAWKRPTPTPVRR
jgi:2-polyprenyl-6-methoxyphenol hydroxylase-like FAD-dependent oxidoreductase